jgi:hypothetical protein
MKPVKNFVYAAVLVSSLALNTLAGDIDVPGYVPPPPPRATSTTDEYTSITDSNTQQPGGETSDYLLFEALAALLSMY